MLSDKIEALVEKLSELRRPVVDVLEPGLSPSRVSELLGPDVPTDVKTWFAWFNGAKYQEGEIQDDVYIIPPYYPISLDEALEIKSIYGSDSDPVLTDPWIPLLTGGGSDMLVAMWKPGQNPVVASVIIGEPTEIEFPSMKLAVSYYIECFKTGAFSIDEDGYMDMDPVACDALHESFIGNGNIPY